MQQFSYLPNLEPSAASQLFRGISEPARNNIGDNTDIAQLAQEKADKNGTAPITEALKDFTSIFKDFHGHDSSNITVNDLKGSLFSNNMFKSKQGINILNEMGSIFQNDIYLHNIAQDNGLRYAQDPKQLKSGALDFAKADIGAIEKSHYTVSDNKGKADGNLNAAEATSAHHGQNETRYSRLISSLNFGNETGSITPEKYASYMIVADALRLNEETGEYEFDFNNADGLISQEEAQLVQKIDNKTLKDFAIQVYNKFYAGLFGKIK